MPRRRRQRRPGGRSSKRCGCFSIFLIPGPQSSCQGVDIALMVAYTHSGLPTIGSGGCRLSRRYKPPQLCIYDVLGPWGPVAPFELTDLLWPATHAASCCRDRRCRAGMLPRVPRHVRLPSLTFWCLDWCRLRRLFWPLHTSPVLAPSTLPVLAVSPAQALEQQEREQLEGLDEHERELLAPGGRALPAPLPNSGGCAPELFLFVAVSCAYVVTDGGAHLVGAFAPRASRFGSCGVSFLLSAGHSLPCYCTNQADGQGGVGWGGLFWASVRLGTGLVSPGISSGSSRWCTTVQSWERSCCVCRCAV